MAKLRPAPYIWVTWLASIMSGENPCHWQAWFRVKHQFPKELPDPKLSEWLIRHTKMLTEFTNKLQERDGALIRKEEQLKYRFLTLDATLAGKADCVCKEAESLTVFDCKTGKKSDSAPIQVMIYMWMISKNPAMSDMTIKGEVVYKDNRVAIDKLPSTFDDDVNFFVELLCNKKPPQTAPGSAFKYCPISKEDCADKVD